MKLYCEHAVLENVNKGQNANLKNTLLACTLHTNVTGNTFICVQTLDSANAHVRAALTAICFMVPFLR